MKVSICLPVYNGARWLGETLDSLSLQSYRDLEVVVSDDSSTDRSRGLVDEWAAKQDFTVTILTHAGRLGPGANFYRCVESASGDYFVAFSQDDLLPRDHVEKSVNLARKFPAAPVVTCLGLVREDSRGKAVNLLGSVHQPSTGKELFLRLLTKNSIFSPGTMIKRELFDASMVGQSNLQANDWEQWLNLALIGPFVSTDSMVTYRLHDANLHRASSSLEFGLDVGLMLRRILTSERFVSFSLEMTDRELKEFRRRISLSLDSLRFSNPLAGALVADMCTIPNISADSKELRAALAQIVSLFEESSTWTATDRADAISKLSELDGSINPLLENQSRIFEEMQRSIRGGRARVTAKWLMNRRFAVDVRSTIFRQA